MSCSSAGAGCGHRFLFLSVPELNGCLKSSQARSELVVSWTSYPCGVMAFGYEPSR